jgi:hypothetical protein
LRGASLVPLLGTDLAAVELTAAWIHGALPTPPARHTVRRAKAGRRHLCDRRLVYRDARIRPEDLVRCGGAPVSTPIRTLTDLCRRPDAASHRAATQLVESGLASASVACAWFEARPTFPYRTSALALLRPLCERPNPSITRR